MSSYHHFGNYTKIFLHNLIDRAPFTRYNFHNMTSPLNWESTFAIAMTLKRMRPQEDLNGVSLRMIYQWTVALPEFEDDPSLANDDILAAIYQDWFEETIHEQQ